MACCNIALDDDIYLPIPLSNYQHKDMINVSRLFRDLNIRADITGEEFVLQRFPGEHQPRGQDVPAGARPDGGGGTSPAQLQPKRKARSVSSQNREWARLRTSYNPHPESAHEGESMTTRRTLRRYDKPDKNGRHEERSDVFKSFRHKVNSGARKVKKYVREMDDTLMAQLGYPPPDWDQRRRVHKPVVETIKDMAKGVKKIALQMDDAFMADMGYPPPDWDQRTPVYKPMKTRVKGAKKFFKQCAKNFNDNADYMAFKF
jgi:hypothetical protein